MRTLTKLGLLLACTIGVQAQVCVPQPPSVTVNPGNASAVAGGVVSTFVYVLNNDTPACGLGTFTMAATVPSGWSAAFSPNPIPASPNSLGAGSLQVTVSGSAPNGTVNIPITATGADGPGNGTLTITVVPAGGGGGGGPSGGGNSTSTLTGVLNKPDGTGVNGTLYLSMSQQAAVSNFGSCGGPVEVVPNQQIAVKVVNGALQSPPTLYANDCMVPQNTYYNVVLKDLNGNNIFVDRWVLTGASVDVGKIVSVVVSGTTGTLGGPGLIFANPPGDQTVVQPTGTNFKVNRMLVSESFVFANQFQCNATACVFGGGVEFDAGIRAGADNFGNPFVTTNSGIWIGTGGNFWNRTFAAGDAACASINDGWTGIRTDNKQVQVCVGGLTKAAPLNPLTAGTSGKAACWFDAHTQGHCTSAVDNTGGCTCAQ